jgi:uncharacterized membrane protein YkoI
MHRRAAFIVVAVAAAALAALWLGQTGPDSAPSDRHQRRVDQIQLQRDTTTPPLDVEEHDRARSLRQQGAILPLQDLLIRAHRHHPGRVLETELEQRDGRYLYEIEILDAQARVWEMRFDARSGELLSEQRDE